jgi:hypothetical protein
MSEGGGGSPRLATAAEAKPPVHAVAHVVYQGRRQPWYATKQHGGIKAISAVQQSATSGMWRAN